MAHAQGAQRVLKRTVPPMRGEDVKKLQHRLRELGFSVTSEDGVFGPELDQAVREFQAAAGLETDGVVGPGTYAAIDKAETPTEEPTVEPAVSKPTTETGSRAPLVEVSGEPPSGAEPAFGNQPARDTLLGAMAYVGMAIRAGMEKTDESRAAVRDLQRALRAVGYLRSGIDGAFGTGTENAIRAFQYDLLHNDGRDEHGGDGAPVRMMDYNRGRVTEVTGVTDEGLAACLRDILEDPAFVLLPLSDDARAANSQIRDRVAQMGAAAVPIPFLLAILQQESNFMHFRQPESGNEDAFIVVGCDHNDREVPYHITSRGYGAGQYTLFHHPPRKEEVEGYMLDVRGNVERAVSHLREKFDAFVKGPRDTSDDRIKEFGKGPLRLCKYEARDSRYMKDCAACLNDARTVSIVSGETPYFDGSPNVFQSTQYHKHDRLDGVPQRSAVGCDWPYAVRRYNGSGVNSFWYQAEVLLKMKPAARAAVGR